MTELMCRPERTIEDIQAILNGQKQVEGFSKFGDTTISEFHGCYAIDMPSEEIGMRISFVIDESGTLKSSNRYFTNRPNADPPVPLTSAEIQAIKRPIFQENRVISEVIATFREELEISPLDTEIAIKSAVIDITTACRRGTVSILTLTPDSCGAVVDELPSSHKPDAPLPSALNSLNRRQWELVIKQVREAVDENEGFKTAA